MWLKWFLWNYELNLLDKKLFFEKKELIKRVFNSYFIQEIRLYLWQIYYEIFILNTFVIKSKLTIENYLYIINVNI